MKGKGGEEDSSIPTVTNLPLYHIPQVTCFHPAMSYANTSVCFHLYLKPAKLNVSKRLCVTEEFSDVTVLLF